MTCSILSLYPCLEGVRAFFRGTIFWFEVAGIGLLVVLGLWVLSKIKDVFGWPGVTALGGFIAGLWLSPKVDAVVSEHVSTGSPDALPSVSTRRPPPAAAGNRPIPPIRRPPDPPRSLTE